MENPQVAKYTRRGAIGTLKLAGSISIDDAEDFRNVAVSALNDRKAGTIKVDLEAVDRLDTSAWQILIALKRDVAADGRSLALTGESHIDGAVTALGFDTLIR